MIEQSDVAKCLECGKTLMTKNDIRDLAERYISEKTQSGTPLGTQYAPHGIMVCGKCENKTAWFLFIDAKLPKPFMFLADSEGYGEFLDVSRRLYEKGCSTEAIVGALQHLAKRARTR